jgi:CMP-N,N'-diacetyllegionaminic acid synthase
VKYLAVIPARSGSKGLKDKNIIDLNGKPLIYYTIKSALDSKRFDEIMVSTDSEKYAEISRKYGAQVPFLRSENMASDSASSWDTVREVLNNYKKMGREFDYIFLLQPTSPLRNSGDIEGVFSMLENSNIENVITVTEVEHPVQWCFTLPENKSMDEMAASPYNYLSRQELVKHYRENGAIYAVKANMIMDIKYNFYGDKCYAYIMPQERSIDIDSSFDLMMVQIGMNDLK